MDSIIIIMTFCLKEPSMQAYFKIYSETQAQSAVDYLYEVVASYAQRYDSNRIIIRQLCIHLGSSMGLKTRGIEVVSSHIQYSYPELIGLT
jgi:hypothetical protein